MTKRPSPPRSSHRPAPFVDEKAAVDEERPKPARERIARDEAAAPDVKAKRVDRVHGTNR